MFAQGREEIQNDIRHNSCPEKIYELISKETNIQIINITSAPQKGKYI